MTTVIVDLGCANIGAVRAAFRRLQVNTVVSADPAIIAAADRLVLPGVGAALPASQTLFGGGIAEALNSSSAPILGICLGMQLMFQSTTEGAGARGLGWIDAKVTALSQGEERVPHMGWSRLLPVPRSSWLQELSSNSYCYFVHGFAAPPGPYSAADCMHNQQFCAAVQHDRFYGTQFHPERSGSIGESILKRFMEAST